MKRPFFAFCVLALLPCVLASWVASLAGERAWRALADESGSRIARLAVGTFNQNLSAAVDSLLASAEPLLNPDTTVEAVLLALAGDTVSAFDPTPSGVDIEVLLPGGQAGTLRRAEGSLVPEAAALVGRITKARIGLYLDGELWSATDPPPSVHVIAPETLLAAAGAPDGVGSDAGVVVAMDPRIGLPAITALAQPEDAGDRAIPLAIRAVIGLLLLFSALAAWILFAKARGVKVDRAPIHTAVVLVACVPLLTLLGTLMHVQRTFEDASLESMAQDLSRTVAVVAMLGLEDSPEAVRALSGRHAARVQAGTVTASTLASGTPELAAVPAPPPSFTTSGMVETSDGTLRYVAKRIDRESFVMVLAEVPLTRIDALRVRLMLIAGVLVNWLLLAAVTLTVRWSRDRSR